MQDMHKILIAIAALAVIVTLYWRQSKTEQLDPAAPPMMVTPVMTTAPTTGLMPLDNESTDFATYPATAPKACDKVTAYS